MARNVLDEAMLAGSENSEIARSVVRRIRRFLSGLEGARRQPNRREAYYICMAMEHLRASRLSECGESLRKANRVNPVPPDIATQVV